LDPERAMPRITPLDRRWQQLMSLCEKESTLSEDGSHPRLLKLVASEIDNLASEMGFTPRRIASRDFRAHRDDGHIVGIIND
jgi:hypothetical protein